MQLLTAIADAELRLGRADSHRLHKSCANLVDSLMSTLRDAGSSLSVARCVEVVRQALGGEAPLTAEHQALLANTLKGAREDGKLAAALTTSSSNASPSPCARCGKTGHRAGRCPTKRGGGRGGGGANNHGNRGGRGGGRGGAPAAAAVAN